MDSFFYNILNRRADSLVPCGFLGAVELPKRFKKDSTERRYVRNFQVPSRAFPLTLSQGARFFEQQTRVAPARGARALRRSLMDLQV